MNAELPRTPPNAFSKVLAVLSLGTFWAMPFAPIITIGALIRTKNTSGWPRRFSVVAAVLCSVYTLAVATWLYYLAIDILAGRFQ